MFAPVPSSWGAGKIKLMSLLTDFAKQAFTQARAVIGGEDVVIDALDAVSMVLNEHDAGRSYESGGYDREDTLEAVGDLTEFEAVHSDPFALLGKTATARGKTFRVRRVSKGQSFVTLNLVAVTQG